ncbi:MAG: ATP-binding protein [Cystobacterineae bacterium]|nr:ATP-binding protein [Cystobacterineae bacterium]
MTLQSQTELLVAIIGCALGTSMLLQSSRSRTSTLYALLAFSISLFYLSRFSTSFFAEASLPSYIALRAYCIFAGILPTTVFSFFLEFLNIHPRIFKSSRRIALVSPVFGLAIGTTPLVHISAAKTGLFLWLIAALAACAAMIFNRIRQSTSRVDQLRLSYLAWGLCASIFFGVIELLLDPSWFQLGSIVTTLYLFLLAQAVLQLRLMDLHEQLGKIVSLSLIAFGLALVFAALTAWWVKLEHLPSFLFNATVAAFVFLILFEPPWLRTNPWGLAFFYRTRHDFIQALQQLQARLLNIVPIFDLTNTLLDGLNDTQRVTHTSVYILAEDRPGFRLLGYRGPLPVFFVDGKAARALLSRTEKAQLIEEIDRRISHLRRQSYKGRKVREELRRTQNIQAAMHAMRSGITVPLFGNDRVLGLLNLWDERVAEAFASDEIALILSLGELLSTALENSKLYERMRERDRLATLGEMAAGLAHEIRNPLGAIKGAVQCLDNKQFSEENRELLDVIVEEVNRLNGVLTAFLDYSRPLKQNFGPIDINQIIVRTLQLLESKMPKNIHIHLELSDNLPKINGDAEQLRQVLLNLLLNTSQALGNQAGNVCIKTLLPEQLAEFRTPNHIEIHVADDGPGIPLEQQKHLFVPFFTTKEKGTGLGLAISQRIIKNHGGNIAFQSKPPEKGSTFIIRLPTSPEDTLSISHMPPPNETSQET